MLGLQVGNPLKKWQCTRDLPLGGLERIFKEISLCDKAIKWTRWMHEWNYCDECDDWYEWYEWHKWYQWYINDINDMINEWDYAKIEILVKCALQQQIFV